MYDFVDRPVISLNRGGRLLVWAMRHWVRAASAGRCPCGDVAPAFHKWKLAHGFAHFHMMMAVLNMEALGKLRFGDVDCERVSEDEALLISMIQAMRDRPASMVRGTAAMIVRADSVTTLLTAQSAVARALADANLFPAAPMLDSDCARYPDE